MLSEQASMAGGAALTTSYQYDAMDNRTRITWPDNYFAQYEYDALTRLTDVRENGSAILAHYDYDTQSRLIAITYGGTTFGSGAARSQTTFAWQVDRDLDLLTHRFVGSTDVTFDYDYDGSGKLTSEIASLSDWIYNAVGSQTDNYGAANNLNQYPSVNGLAVSYDLNGNRTAFNGLATPHDSENRLTGIGSTLIYQYDADGRRTARVQSSSTTRFAHAGDMEIAEYDSTVLTHRYIPGHSVDQRIAWKNVAAGTTHYFHANRLGSVQAVVNSADGAVTDQYVYTPFGVQEPLSTTGNPFRYTGRRLDSESGLYYYRARYYDPVHGRFLETDPIGYRDQMNMYAYVGNDPLNVSDPTGMCAENCINITGMIAHGEDPFRAQQRELSRNMPAHRAAMGGTAVGAAILAAPAAIAAAGATGTTATVATGAVQSGLISGAVATWYGASPGEVTVATAGGTITGGAVAKVGAVMQAAPKFAQSIVSFVGGFSTAAAVDSVDGEMNSSAGDYALSGLATIGTSLTPKFPVTTGTVGAVLDSTIEVDEPNMEQPEDDN